MPFVVNSYAALDAETPLQPYKLERRDLFEDDVLVDIVYTGICHTDLHFGHNDWGYSKFPCIPGHEIVGTVSKVGGKVTKHKVGDLVAVGCIVDSCRTCSQCLEDEENYCAETNTQAYNDPERRFPGHITAGGYAEQIVVPEHFVLTVPKELQTKENLPGVAPILCAGITMYAPFKAFNIKPGQKVGIAGFGGLGQMGIKIGKALGFEMYVISRSHKKDAEARAAGASGVIDMSSDAELKQFGSTLDFMIDTIPYEHDLNKFFALLKVHCTIVVLGHYGYFDSKPIHTSNLILGNRRLAGSVIGGIKATQEVLELCAAHNIIADNTIISMEQVNEAWRNMGNSSKRYVIDIAEYRRANANNNL